MTLFGTIFLSSGSLVDLDATVFIQLGIFLLVLILLRKLLFQPVTRLIEARYDATTGALEASKTLSEEADSLNNRILKKLDAARASGSEKRVEIVKAAHVKEREIIRKGRTEAHNILTELRAETEKEAQRAREQLKGDVEQLATVVASKVLDRKL